LLAVDQLVLAESNEEWDDLDAEFSNHVLGEIAGAVGDDANG
jgi:hypothetical protein